MKNRHYLFVPIALSLLLALTACAFDWMPPKPGPTAVITSTSSPTIKSSTTPRPSPAPNLVTNDFTPEQIQAAHDVAWEFINTRGLHETLDGFDHLKFINDRNDYLFNPTSIFHHVTYWTADAQDDPLIFSISLLYRHESDTWEIVSYGF